MFFEQSLLDIYFIISKENACWKWCFERLAVLSSVLHAASQCVCFRRGVQQYWYTQGGWSFSFWKVWGLFWLNFSGNLNHFWCLHVCERDGSAVTADDDQLLCSGPNPHQHAVLTSSQFPLPELQCRKCLTTCESLKLQREHGRAWAWRPAWTPDISTWWKLQHLRNYNMFMSCLQGSGTEICLCSASSHGRGLVVWHAVVHTQPRTIYVECEEWFLLEWLSSPGTGRWQDLYSRRHLKEFKFDAKWHGLVMT